MCNREPWNADPISIQHGCVGSSPFTKRPGRRVYYFGFLDDATDFVEHLTDLGAAPHNLGRSVELRKSQDRRLPKCQATKF